MSTVAAFFDKLAALGTPMWAPIESRLNPILVKEVRQSLRGRYFSVVFWLMVAIAATIGCMLLVSEGTEPDSDGGVMFFIAMYGCLSLCVHVFVPFSVFLAVGAEWDENTYDLLVLSDLKPRQIVFGKLLSAGIQVLLFYSAFGPFLAFAFLLRGLDLVVAAWILGGTLLTSLGLACVALCLSSLTRHRFARVLLMAALAAGLLGCWGASQTATAQMFMVRLVHTPEFVQGALAFFSFVLTVASYALVLGATRFAHPEENRSTGLRVLTSLVVLVALGWALFLYDYFGDPEIIGFLGTLTLVGLTVSCTVFLAEEERLGRRVCFQVPRNPLAALFASPYLPGGGRAVLFYLLHAGLVVITILAVLLLEPNPSRDLTQARNIPLILLLYLASYALIPTALLARWTKDVRVRVLSRLLVPLFGLLSFVVPTVGLFMLGERSDADEHFGNPVWVVDFFDTRPFPVGVVALPVVALLLNLPRVVRALREVLRESASRRAAVVVRDPADAQAQA